MLSIFPRGVLDEIWDLIKSVSEGLSTYSSIKPSLVFFVYLMCFLVPEDLHSKLVCSLSIKQLGCVAFCL